MFKLVWTFGYLIGGAPHIQTMPAPLEPMQIEECRAVAAMTAGRMSDWVRGVLRRPLDFPVAVHGDCVPVLRDATQRE